MNREPALLISAIATVVVAILGIFDIVIEADALETALLAVIPLVSGLITRQKVTPVGNTLTGRPADHV